MTKRGLLSVWLCGVLTITSTVHAELVLVGLSGGRDNWACIGDEEISNFQWVKEGAQVGKYTVLRIEPKGSRCILRAEGTQLTLVLTGTKPIEMPDSWGSFVSRMRDGIENGRAEELMRLHCWDGVSAEIQGGTRSHLATPRAVESIHVTPIEESLSAEARDHLMAISNFNVPVTKVIAVRYKGVPGSQIYYAGIKNGRLLIAAPILHQN